MAIEAEVEEVVVRVARVGHYKGLVQAGNSSPQSNVAVATITVSPFCNRIYRAKSSRIET